MILTDQKPEPPRLNDVSLDLKDGTCSFTFETLNVWFLMFWWWSAVGQSDAVFRLQGEFPTSSHCGNKVYSQCFVPLPPPVSLQKDCIKETVVSVCNPEATRSEQQTGLSLRSSFTSAFIRSLPFPLHAKDTAKATAIVFKLFILSQDCVVIYNVNTENTL